MRDVFARDDQILTAIVDAAQHDVTVRMTGIEMVDRDPVELRAEVLFHRRHQPAHERLQIGIEFSFLRRNDEAKLVPVIRAAVEEGRAVSDILARVVELARLALTRDPVTLDIFEMRARRRNPFGTQSQEPRLHDDAARCIPVAAAARRQQSTVRGAPPDTASVEAAEARRKPPNRHARSEQPPEIFSSPLAARRTHAPEPRLEIFLVAAHAPTPSRNRRNCCSSSQKECRNLALRVLVSPKKDVQTIR